MPGPAYLHSNQRHAVSRSNLIYLFDASLSQSTTGSVWSDVSGGAGTLTPQNGALFISDGYKSHYQFDGATGNRNLIANFDQPLYSTTTGYSWSAWINPQVSNNAPILGNRTRGGVINSSTWCKLASRRMEYTATGTGVFIGSSGTPLMTLNVWQYVNIVWDSGTLRGYVNGVEFGTTPYSNMTLVQPFYVGGDLVQPERSESRVAYVAIHNVALSPTQIQADFNAMRGGYGI